MSVEDSFEEVTSVDSDIQVDVNFCNDQLEMTEELINSEEKSEGDITTIIHERMEILQENPIYKPKIILKLFRPPMIVDKASKENADAGDKANRAKILSQHAYNQIILFKINPKSFPKEERKSMAKVARTFELEDDGTGGDWPKGKVLHKIFFTKKNLRKGIKLYVPPDQVQNVIKHFHQKGANKHHGWTRTYSLVKEKHAGITEHMVRDFSNKCEVCISFTNVQKKPRLKPILSLGIMDRMQIDLKEFTFYEEWNDGYSYMLTIVDHFSGYPWAYPLFTKTASEVSFHLVNLFFMFGPPRILHSDNGGEFVNALVASIADVFHFECAHGKAYNPREQGKVEKFNGTISNTISKLMFERKSKRWIDMLDEALFSYRITKGVAGQSPFQIFFLRPPHFVYHFPGTVLPEVPDPEANVIDQLEILDVHANLIQSVREMREKNAAKMKSRFDTVNTQVVKVGDYVLVDARIKKKWRAKAILGERIYSMPGIVSEVNANGNILVRYKNGLETPFNKPVPNNQFKVIDEEMYKSVEMSPIEEDGEDRSDEVPSNGVGQSHQALGDEIQRFDQPGTNSNLQFIKVNMDVQNDYMEVPVGWKPIPGLRVAIYWSAEQKWYKGEVVKFVGKNQKWLIVYSDGDRSEHTFRSEKWRVCSDQIPRLMKTFRKSIENMNA